MTSIDIVGAGMAGLLAAAMLRKDVAAIYEKSKYLPNNHSAVLRFRSSVVADTLNIPFKEVSAFKATQAWLNPIAEAMSYSAKTNGSYALRSITSADGRVSKRYIAPSDLIQRMADLVDCPIVYGRDYRDWLGRSSGLSVISTVPMPVLMKALGWKEIPDFKSREGMNITATIDDAEAYCSLYVPDPRLPFARVSVTGDQLIAECYERGAYADLVGREEDVAAQAAALLGIDQDRIRDIRIHRQKYGKILPIDERLRREFVMWASEKHGVYSLGRFATWRPGLLLDDIVNDVRVIHRLIRDKGASYAHKLKG